VSPPRRVIPSEIASSVNAAVAQAYETHRAAASENISQTIQEEIRRGFMEMMAMINQVVQPLKETAAAVRELQQTPRQGEVGVGGGHRASGRPEAASTTGAYPKAKPEVEEPRRSPPKPPRAHSSDSDRGSDARWYPGGHPRANGWQHQPYPMAHEARPCGGEGLRGPERREEAVRGVRIEKWEIFFDGDPNKLAVEDFVFRVEYLQRQSRCSWDQVLGSFYQLMRGQAAEWYWQFVRESPPQTWEDLKESLVARFRGRGGE
ncbi:hypothetical protein KR032_002142, partial [Drosophila birchii]